MTSAVHIYVMSCLFSLLQLFNGPTLAAVRVVANSKETCWVDTTKFHTKKRKLQEIKGEVLYYSVILLKILLNG